MHGEILNLVRIKLTKIKQLILITTAHPDSPICFIFMQCYIRSFGNYNFPVCCVGKEFRQQTCWKRGLGGIQGHLSLNVLLPTQERNSRNTDRGLQGNAGRATSLCAYYRRQESVFISAETAERDQRAELALLALPRLFQKSETSALASQGVEENFQDSVQSFGCAGTAGRLLPQFG